MSIQSYAFIDGIDPVSPADHATKNYVDLTRKVPYVRAYRAAGISFTAGQNYNPFIYDTKVAGTDPGNNYSTSTGIYTCPIPGLYFVRASLSMGFTAAGIATVSVQWNAGGFAVMNNQNPSGTNATVCESVGIILAAAGDTFQVSASSSIANPARAVAGETNLVICWLAGGAL